MHLLDDKKNFEVLVGACFTTVIQLNVRALLLEVVLSSMKANEKPL